MNDERLIELEIKVAHQEVVIEELQQALYDHHLLFEKQAKEIAEIKKQLDDKGAPEIGPHNQKPPHY